MFVRDIMTTNVTTVKPDTLVTEVAEILHTNRITGVPVVNDEGTVVGIVAERDFIASSSNLYLPTYITLLSNMDYVQGAGKNLPHVVDQIVRAKASDIMNTQLRFASPDMTVEDLAGLFSEGVNPVPVTNPANKLVGVVTRSDMIKLISPKVTTLRHLQTSHTRMIDQEVEFTKEHFTSKFAYVAKARANIWMTAIIVLFIIGFLAGVIYVADPSIIVKQESTTQH